MTGSDARAAAVSPSQARLVGGACAVLGGTAWAVWVVLGERQPPCCPGGVSNPFLPYEWWKLAAFALLAVAAGTLAVGPAALPRGLARVGAAVVCGGGALGTASIALEAAGARLDRPFAEIAALVLLVPMGTALLGGAALVDRLLPRAVAAALLVGGVAFVGGNSERRTMLLWAVLGVAWALWGAVTLRQGRWRDGAAPVRHPEAPSGASPLRR